MQGGDAMKKYMNSKTCSNCKYMSAGIDRMSDMSYCNADEALVDAWQDTIEMNDFGCNKWEKKDEV